MILKKAYFIIALISLQLDFLDYFERIESFLLQIGLIIFMIFSVTFYLLSCFKNPGFLKNNELVKNKSFLVKTNENNKKKYFFNF